MNTRKTLVISIAILVAAAGITTLIFITEPKVKREGATRETAMLVEVDTIYRSTYHPVILTTGTVVAEQDIVLRSRVSGEVIRLSPLFVPGGFIEKGQVLLQIDPADYENDLARRKSELQQARAELDIEMGRQNVAREDYRLLEETLKEENRALVLREPQLKVAQSLVRAAEVNLTQAELNLQRTTIRAPFDAHIISRNANLGSLISAGGEVGRIVGYDRYWVIATVPLSKIGWLTFPDNGEKGSPAKIRHRTAWEKDEYRLGRLFRLVSALEDNTRLARLIVEVEDPLNFLTGSDSRPKLMVGSFVEVEVQGREIKNVFRLKRDYVRGDNTVWVMQGDSLQIRDVEIAFSDAIYAYITDGLEDGNQIVKTNLSTVAEGVKLRTVADTADSFTYRGD